MTELATLSLAALTALHNEGVADYAPEGFAEVKRFASKAKAIDAIGAMCAVGSLAIAFDGDKAAIVDAMEAAEDAAPDVTVLGDGKGAVRAWGAALASDEWLAAHPRGTPEREAYRKARKALARGARKARAKVTDAANLEAAKAD